MLGNEHGEFTYKVRPVPRTISQDTVYSSIGFPKLDEIESISLLRSSYTLDGSEVVVWRTFCVWNSGFELFFYNDAIFLIRFFRDEEFRDPWIKNNTILPSKIAFRECDGLGKNMMRPRTTVTDHTVLLPLSFHLQMCDDRIIRLYYFRSMTSFPIIKRFRARKQTCREAGIGAQECRYIYRSKQTSRNVLFWQPLKRQHIIVIRITFRTRIVS